MQLLRAMQQLRDWGRNLRPIANPSAIGRNNFKQTKFWGITVLCCYLLVIPTIVIAITTYHHLSGPSLTNPREIGGWMNDFCKTYTGGYDWLAVPWTILISLFLEILGIKFANDGHINIKDYAFSVFLLFIITGYYYVHPFTSSKTDPFSNGAILKNPKESFNDKFIEPIMRDDILSAKTSMLLWPAKRNKEFTERYIYGRAALCKLGVPIVQKTTDKSLSEPTVIKIFTEEMPYNVNGSIKNCVQIEDQLKVLKSDKHLFFSHLLYSDVDLISNMLNKTIGEEKLTISVFSSTNDSILIFEEKDNSNQVFTHNPLGGIYNGPQYLYLFGVPRDKEKREIQLLDIHEVLDGADKSISKMWGSLFSPEEYDVLFTISSQINLFTGDDNMLASTFRALLDDKYGLDENNSLSIEEFDAFTKVFLLLTQQKSLHNSKNEYKHRFAWGMYRQEA